MKKLLLLLLLSLGYASTGFANTKISALVDGWIFYFPDTFYNEDHLVAVDSSKPDIFNALKTLLPPEVELIIAYMLPEDLDRITRGEEPTMAKFVQVTTIPNDGKGYTPEEFKKEIDNNKQELIDNKNAFNLVKDLLEEQSEMLSSESGIDIENTISTLIPFTPYMDTDDAFVFTYLAVKEQRVNGQYSRTARLTTTLKMLLMNGRIINTAVYSNYKDNNSVLFQETSVRVWYDELNDLTIELLKSFEDATTAEDSGDYSKAIELLRPIALLGDIWAIDEIIRLNDRVDSEDKDNNEDKNILDVIKDANASEDVDLEALFEFQLPEKFDNTALEVMMNKPASVWDLGYLKLKMKINEYLLDTDYEARPQEANAWINAKGGLNFSLTMPGGWKNHEVFRGKDLAYKCEIMRQHFTSNLLGWNGNVNEMYISHRILGELFNPFGSEKQRVTLGELLLADSTLKFYDWNEPNKLNCEFKTLEKFNYYRDTVVKLDNAR